MMAAEPKRDVIARSVAVVAGVVALGAVVAALPRVAAFAERHRPAEMVMTAYTERELAPPVNPTKLGGLMAARPDTPQRFLPAASPTGSVICGELADAGFANSGWVRSGVGGGRWECYAAAEHASPTQAYSLFYMLRGATDRLDEMRVKVTLHDAAAATSLRAEMANFIDAFVASAHVAFPPAFLASVRSGSWATYVSPRATYTFAREEGEVPKWNLSVAFADPSDIERANAALSLPVKAVRGTRARALHQSQSPDLTEVQQ